MTNTTTKLLALGALCATALLQGCYTPSTSGSVYSPGQARNEQTVRMAVVESVRQVTIEGSQGQVGTIAGGALGGIGGSTVGQGRGSTAAAVLGAVAGGVAGSVIERNATKKKGYEITVKLANGDLRAITQDADEEFTPGERVRLVSSGGITRVTH